MRIKQFVKKTTTKDNQIVLKRSSYEEIFGKELLAHIPNVQYEPFKLEYKEPEKIKKYTPDFVILNTVIESKGRFDKKDRDKMALVKQQHPEFRFILVFQYNNWLTTAHKARYSDWCDKNGFEYILWTGSKKAGPLTLESIQKILKK